MVDLSEKQLKAQEVLSEVNNAINRDNLILEEKEKEIKLKKQEAYDLDKEINALNLKRNDEKESLISTQKKNSLEREKLNEQKHDLVAFISKLENNKLELESEIEELNKNKSITEEKINAEHRKLRTELSKEISKKQDEKKDLELELSEVRLLISNEEIILSNLQAKADKLIEKEKELNICESKIEERTQYLVSINWSIEDSEVVNKKLKKDESIIKSEIIELSKQKTQLDLDIKAIESEKESFAKEKFILLSQKEDLDKREEFIKEKYIQAWVKF